MTIENQIPVDGIEVVLKIKRTGSNFAVVDQFGNLAEEVFTRRGSYLLKQTDDLTISGTPYLIPAMITSTKRILGEVHNERGASIDGRDIVTDVIDKFRMSYGEVTAILNDDLAPNGDFGLRGTAKINTQVAIEPQ